MSPFAASRGRALVPALLACLTATGVAAGVTRAAVLAPTLTTAPGRVVVVPHPVRSHGTDRTGLAAAVSLPDGRIVVGGYDPAGPVVVRLRRDGSLDRTFGSAGVMHVARRDGAGVRQILPLPAGRLIAVVDVPTEPNSNYCSHTLLVRLTAAGALDRSYGEGGIAVPGILNYCGRPERTALAADGAVFASGVRDVPGTNSIVCVVAKLTSAGLLDASFGQGGFTTVGKLLPGGSATPAVAAGGRVLVEMDTREGAQLSALTPAGAPDPGFNGGAPLTWSEHGVGMVLQPGGAIDLYRQVARVVQRLTPDGAPDDAFGTRGSVAIGRIEQAEFYRPEPAAGGGVILIYSEWGVPDPGLILEHVTALGRALPRVKVVPSFGGGYLEERGSKDRHGFGLSRLVVRPDGSYLMAGGVSVDGRTEGGGHTFASGMALAAYRADFTLDPSFGGPQRARLVVRRSRRHAAAGTMRVRVTSSGPGDAQLSIRDDHGRLLARRVLPIYGRETATVALRLERAVARGSSVVIGYDFLDLASGHARGTVHARL